MMKYKMNEVVGQFAFEGSFISAVPYGHGHINDTFAAAFQKRTGESHRYILQRINQKVFKDPVRLMKNIEGVTEHLRKKILETGGDPLRETLTLVHANDGSSYWRDPEGNYWRAYVFIEGAQTYQLVESKAHFYNAGLAFGNFQKLLCDYPADTLYETIPDFHNTYKRYEAFADVLGRDPLNRAAGVREEIAFVEKRAHETSILTDLIRDGKLPLKVTHNDTKFNNVMIDDRTGRGICVIDLDTVMPGAAVYDFGDSIRSGATTGLEDEMNLSKVHVDFGLFESFSRGFLETAGAFLAPGEIEALPTAAKMMTLECGIRFLADYLNGDTYFKIQREEHNLDRCRTQFKLVAEMEEHFDFMGAVVDQYSRV